MSFKLSTVLLREFRNNVAPCIRKRFQSTVATNLTIKDDSKDKSKKKDASQLAEYRFIYPEFLADPNFEFRNKVRERLERSDMLKRRSLLYIPEFYVGSVLAVVATDPYAPGKKKRFVGICIHRTYNGLRATFTLRNVIDNQGLEIMYDMYNPTILSIDVLRLEKRLDDELFYLRDAYPEYSTFPLDMEPEVQAEGVPVPVNPLKVKLKPYPWHVKWEQRNMKGIESTDEAPYKKRVLAKRIETPWERYDLVKEYRKLIPEEDQVEIWEDLEANIDKFPSRKVARKKSLFKAERK